MKRQEQAVIARVVVFAIFGLCAAGAFGEPDERLHADGKGWRLDQAKIIDVDRPRVLLIGDSILNGYLADVITGLEGTAYVDAWVNPHHQSEHLNKLLADVLEQGPYDVVHFNMGLHGWPSGRIKSGTFVPLTKAYVEVLRAELPTARLVWANSTPVTSADNPEELEPEINPVIVEHNRLAADVMAEMTVPVNDFYALLNEKRTLSKGDRFHWTRPAYQLLSNVVIESVERELKAAEPAGELASGTFSITQTWSQETDYERPYLVEVPEREEGDALPVLLFLHGNGGNARRARNGFLHRYPNLSQKFITVFAEGYEKSWNIVSERSKADDRGFVEAIVFELAKHENVQGNAISIMGSSNGAALANQIAIETKLPNIKNYVTSVSPLNAFQYDGKNFKAKGESNDYVEATNPLTGIRLLNISGTTDRLVPYTGGPSPVIPARDGKLPFVAAEESTFVWARHLGYEGEKLTKPTKAGSPIEIFSYLGGDVLHLKVIDHGHNASSALSEELLLEFLNK